MRPIAQAGLLFAVLALLAPSTVLAQSDYIAGAVQALQRTPVYVAPGTERTDRDTAAKLQARLLSDDLIVLIMLPASAEAELKADPFVIATQLSEQLGNQRIVGLAVGNKMEAYAPSLPAGVATDQMRRAQSVSNNDPVTTLGTFAQNIHIWQRANPRPKPPVVLPQPAQDSSFPIPLAFLPPAIIAGGVFLIIKRRQEMARKRIRERVYASSPDLVADLLSQVARKREQITDEELGGLLRQMCEDMDRYFASCSKDKERDTLFFKDRLTDLVAVLTKYIDVQNHPRYYRAPTVELNRGKEAIQGFSEFVLESVRRGHQEDLLDYAVNTRILEAQRYR